MNWLVLIFALEAGMYQQSAGPFGDLPAPVSYEYSAPYASMSGGAELFGCLRIVGEERLYLDSDLGASKPLNAMFTGKVELYRGAFRLGYEYLYETLDLGHGILSANSGRLYLRAEARIGGK